MKEALFEVVNETGGTAFYAGRSKKTIISGKTGTAQVRAFSDISKIKDCQQLPYNERHHGWFVGYAPKENPEIAVVVIAEHSCHGTAGAPIVREVIEAYIDKKNGVAQLANQGDQKTAAQPVQAGVGPASAGDSPAEGVRRSTAGEEEASDR